MYLLLLHMSGMSQCKVDKAVEVKDQVEMEASNNYQYRQNTMLNWLYYKSHNLSYTQYVQMLASVLQIRQFVAMQ